MYLHIHIYGFLFFPIKRKARKNVKPTEEDRTYMSLDRRDRSPEYDVIAQTPKWLLTFTDADLDRYQITLLEDFLYFLYWGKSSSFVPLHFPPCESIQFKSIRTKHEQLYSVIEINTFSMKPVMLTCSLNITREVLVMLSGHFCGCAVFTFVGINVLLIKSSTCLIVLCHRPLSASMIIWQVRWNICWYFLKQRIPLSLSYNILHLAILQTDLPRRMTELVSASTPKKIF